MIFFDKFSNLEVSKQHEDRFRNDIWKMYKLSRKNKSITPTLVDNMKQINMNMKKENLRDTTRLSRLQKSALNKYCSSPEFKKILKRIHIPRSKSQLETEKTQ